MLGILHVRTVPQRRPPANKLTTLARVDRVAIFPKSMRQSQLRPFLAGAAAAYLSILVMKQWNKRKPRINGKDTRRRRQQQHEEEVANGYGSKSNNKPLIDSPKLDQRMIRKAEGAIRLRTSRLIIVIERCTNDHNYSAIHRTAEALGVQHIYVISPPAQSTLEGAVSISGDEDEDIARDITENAKIKAIGKGGKVVKGANRSELKDRAMHHLFAQKATEWLDVREFDTTAECLAALRQDGYAIWATDLSQEAICLTESDLIIARQNASGRSSSCTAINHPIPDRLAIAFGTEAVGCTAELLNEADLRVYLPLRGFADSLNLSVATALVVHHLFVLDPTLVGAMSEEERMELRKKWYAKLCRQRLLSSSAKRERSRLLARVRTAEEYERKRDAGEVLDKNQELKLTKLKEDRATLEKLDQDLDAKAKLAVQGLVRNPPEPITDMRRADEHRATFVGKNTKKMYGKTWANMPATANTQTVQSGTSQFFRDKLNEDSADIGTESNTSS